MSRSSPACGGGGARKRAGRGKSVGPTQSKPAPSTALRAVPRPRCAGADIWFHIAESQAASAETSCGVSDFIRSVMPGLLPRAPLWNSVMVFSR